LPESLAVTAWQETIETIPVKLYWIL